MKKLIMLIILCFGIASCGSMSSDNWKDKTAESISGGAAAAVAKALDCSNKEAIQEDIKGKILELSWFKKDIQKETKGLGSSLCVLVAGAVLPPLVGMGAEQVPEKWGCTAASASESIVSLAKMGCQAIPY